MNSPPNPSDDALTVEARQVASGGRIRGLLVLFSVALMVSLTGMMLLLVSNIFDRLTPSIKNDLEWKAEHGARELAKSLDIAIAAEDLRMIEQSVSAYLQDDDVAGILVQDRRGNRLYATYEMPIAPQTIFAAAPSGIARHQDWVWSWSTVELESTPLGKVALVVSLDRLNEGLRLKRNMLASAGAACLTALALSLLFFRFWIGPLLSLVGHAFQQLERTTATALESTRLKSEFIANMSHEIRTPMNGVVGMTELMLQTPLSDRQRRYARTIADAASTLMVIINDVLDFSKIEAFKLQLRRQSFSLHDMLEELAVLLSERAHSKDLELAVRIPQDVPDRVSGDPDRLRQVLTNLVSNAIKFTERGEVVLEASVAADIGGRTTVRFDVTDTGIGIAPDDQERLFRAFSQIDGSLTRKHGGTGLGLAISKRLTELMGGTLSLRSAPGEGSTFSLQVPLERSAEASITQRPQLSVRRVLAVDDNATNRTILQEQLESWNVRHDCASSAEEALSYLEQAQNDGDEYTAVLTDMQMPGMSGLDLALAIRKNPAFENLYIVVLSSIGALASEELGLAEWVDLVLVKPVKRRDLARALQIAGTPETEEPPPFSRNIPRRLRAQRRYDGTILLVEDHPLNQRVMEDMLGALGCKFDLASNGEQALECLKESEYSLVLMDCQMPVMDGYEAARVWREFESESGSRRTPIVACTAHAINEERERVTEAGMDDFLPKPVQLKALEEIIQRWVQSDEETPIRENSGDTVLAPDKQRSKELRDIFIEQVRLDLRAVEDAHERGDVVELRSKAHRIKGSARTFGATQLGEWAAHIEASAKRGDLPDGSALRQLRDLVRTATEKAAELSL